MGTGDFWGPLGVPQTVLILVTMRFWGAHVWELGVLCNLLIFWSWFGLTLVVLAETDWRSPCQRRALSSMAWKPSYFHFSSVFAKHTSFSVSLWDAPACYTHVWSGVCLHSEDLKASFSSGICHPCFRSKGLSGNIAGKISLDLWAFTKETECWLPRSGDLV